MNLKELIWKIFRRRAKCEVKGCGAYVEFGSARILTAANGMQLRRLIFVCGAHAKELVNTPVTIHEWL